MARIVLWKGSLRKMLVMSIRDGAGLIRATAELFSV
jgi:hypothetical protein